MTVEQLTEEVKRYLCLNELPEFVHDDITLRNHADIWGCALSIETRDEQDVPVRDIVGIAQAPFNTWLSFLLSDDRWDRDKFGTILRLAKSNPGYYEDRCKKHEWDFTCIDGKYYVLNGHHRTAIVKLLGATGAVNIVRNVTVEYIRCDHDLLTLTAQIRDKFKGLGQIYIDKYETTHQFRFKPRFKFCLPLNGDLDSFRGITRGKALRIFIWLLWQSCWSVKS